MATLKETAKAYVPQQTKNIAELESVPVDIEVKQETHQDKDGNDFDINIIEVKGEKYRVPNSVIKNLKVILEKMPDLTNFAVLKSGQGLDTSYQVIPYTK